MAAQSGHERVLMLVKALPHAGDRHGETVCCAGITLEREWRRQFPVPFHYLEGQKFVRWQWVEYDWQKPTDDKRLESQRVLEGTIKPGKIMSKKERAGLLNPMIVGSISEAADNNATLALVRPRDPVFSNKKKSPKKIEKERRQYAVAADQLSFLTHQQKPVEPCPYEFRFKYTTQDGRHDNICGDWETAAMFYKFSRKYGEKDALRMMDETFNLEYPDKGMAFVMGTLLLYPSTWHLLGVIRLDEVDQMTLL